MEIAEAVRKHKGKPYHIEGATSNDLAKFIKDHGCKIGVEIGVHGGEFTKILAETGIERIYGVDPGEFTMIIPTSILKL